MRSPFRPPHLLLVLCCLLAACGPQTNGSPKPPAEFGAVAGRLFSCPSMQGVYAWPPVAGQYADGFPTNRSVWEGAIPLQVFPREMQIWLQQTPDKIILRSRIINRAGDARDQTVRDWSHKEYTASKYSCWNNMLEFDAVESGSASNYGGTGLRRGFKLVRLKDGGIAVGIKSISTGRTSAIFGWGGVSYGSYIGPDVTYWSWSKLASTGPGDTEPAPVGAYRPGAPASR